MIKKAVSRSLESKSQKIIALLVFLFSMALYVLAIEQTGSLSAFFQHSPFVIVFVQIVLSILNSLLLAFSVVMIITTVRNKQSEQAGSSFFQTLVALFFSVTSTGCYVCGSVLFPAVGVASSFASLPFGGIEIKFLTTLLLLYTVQQSSRQVLGICDLEPDKKLVLQGGGALRVSFPGIKQLQSFAIVSGFIISIFLLPVVLPSGNIIQADSQYVCVHN